MRELWFACKRPLAFCWGASIVLALLTLGLLGQISLFGAYFIGTLAAGVFLGILLLRTERGSHLPASQAKRVMLGGFGLRLLTVVLVFGAAVRISPQVFYATVAGFFVTFFLCMALIVRHWHALAGEKSSTDRG